MPRALLVIDNHKKRKSNPLSTFRLGLLPRDMKEDLYNMHAMSVDPDATEKSFYTKRVPLDMLSLLNIKIDKITDFQPYQKNMPPLVVADGKLIDGQHRITSARKAGVKQLPYIDVTGLIDTKTMGYISELPKTKRKNPKGGRPKITEAQKERIRFLYAETNMHASQIARSVGVSVPTAQKYSVAQTVERRHIKHGHL